MADKTKIEWADATWNPITGCTIVSPGCTNCYAMRLAGTRLKHFPSRKGLTKQVNGNHIWTGAVRFNEKELTKPLHWRKPRMIFVCAHGDLFHEDVPDGWIDKIFAVMALCPQHTFQVLTKRPERMKEYVRKTSTGRYWPKSIGGPIVNIEGYMPPQGKMAPFPLPNVWLGVSVEDQKRADERIPHLLDTPAAMRFISAEPLLGQIDLTIDGLIFENCPDDCEHSHIEPDTNAFVCNHCEDSQKTDDVGIDWIIVGGESGPKARPMHPDWARSLRNQCAAAGVPFFFKQWGSWAWSPEDMNYGAGKQWAKQLKAKDVLFASSGHTVALIGKSRAGRLLEGVEHNGMPEAKT